MNIRETFLTLTINTLTRCIKYKPKTVSCETIDGYRCWEQYILDQVNKCAALHIWASNERKVQQSGQPSKSAYMPHQTNG